MINILLRFLKSKKLILYYLLSFVMMFFMFSPLLIQTENYILQKYLILNKIELFKSMLLPIAYLNSNGILLNICTDITFYLMILYPNGAILDYFLKDAKEVLLPKIGRNKWIKNILLYEFIYCFLICLIYILFVILLLFFYYNMVININSFTIIMAFFLKFTISLLSVYLYSLITLITDDNFYSMILSITVYFIINFIYYLIIKMTYKHYDLIFIITNSIIIIIIEILCKYFIKNKDL